MKSPVIRVLGRRVRPLERIPTMGIVLGLYNKTASYRMCASEGWPLVGPPSSHYVNVVRLLEQLDIPYEVECDDEPPADAGARGVGPDELELTSSSREERLQ